MNKIITIYNLLGLIKDDKAPKKIKYSNTIYEYEYLDKEYQDKDGDTLVNGAYIGHHLNEKVEIIEEDKDIELLNLDTDKLKGKEVIRAIDYLLEGRINELVKEVNKLRKDNNNG